MTDSTPPTATRIAMHLSQILEYSHACFGEPDTRKPASGTMPRKITSKPASFR